MRVSLALALARAPKVLIVDEPLIRLSPHNQEALANSLRTLAGRGAAVITSGHDAQVLLSISDVNPLVCCRNDPPHRYADRSPGASQFRREYLGAEFGADGERL